MTTFTADILPPRERRRNEPRYGVPSRETGCAPATTRTGLRRPRSFGPNAIRPRTSRLRPFASISRYDVRDETTSFFRPAARSTRTSRGFMRSSRVPG